MVPQMQPGMMAPIQPGMMMPMQPGMMAPMQPVNADAPFEGTHQW